MPLYEDKTNAENVIAIPEQQRQRIIRGKDQVVEAVFDAIQFASSRKSGAVRVAFDGWYGIDWKKIIGLFKNKAQAENIDLTCADMATVYQKTEAVQKYKAQFLTDDPSFGFANLDGRFTDVMDADALENLKTKLDAFASKNGIMLVHGPGAAIAELNDHYDLKFYFDKTRQPVLWQIWDGELVPFNDDKPATDYNWKEYYYCDYYLLHNQKYYAFEQMDYYVEAVETEEMKLLPRDVYDTIMSTLVHYPIKMVKQYQPGPWGAYRYRDIADVPGLENNAWCRTAGSELGMLVQVDDDVVLNMAMTNLLQYSEELLGNYLTETYPGLFPLDTWFDDGYHPKPQPAERTSMPIHNHPGTDYVQRHFNEPLGRYETYYIAEAFEGANTWMGFHDDIDLEEWEEKCRESDANKTKIEDWKDYIAGWDTNVGDLFLIPPGTTHCHGGNQMVLEMDTCPSIAGTEYSFFTYDFMRPTWDDEKKSMTGKPMKMHLEHGFDNNKWRRASWVKEHLKARPKVVKWTKEYAIDRYDSRPSMPFTVERIHFQKRGQYDTEGKFAQIATLTVGQNVTIRSLENPELQTSINRFQSVIIPACFGAYEALNEQGGDVTVVLFRWKIG